MPENAPQVLSLDQKRAAYAWECVRRNANDDYTNLAKGAPALIMNNGLMQTLAFYESKKEHHQKLQQDILHWLQTCGLLRRTEYAAAMAELYRMSTSNYRLASMEALEILKWIRQLAAAHGSAQNASTREG